MFAALLAKLVPIRDYLYIGLIVAIIGFGVYERNHLIDEGKAKEIASVEAATKKAVAATQAQIKQLTDEHNATVQAIQEKASEDLKVAASQHDSDAQRLREYDAYRASHPDVQSPPSGGTAGGTGSQGGFGYDGSFTALESVALELATAGRETQIALQSCIAERNDLTGK